MNVMCKTILITQQPEKINQDHCLKQTYLKHLILKTHINILPLFKSRTDQ